MHIPTFIEQKRDGGELSAGAIDEFIRGFVSGEIPEYQASAWAMAVYFRGMTSAETGNLTRSMMRSGRVLQYPSGSPPKVDKHSTGGVGDKVSLVLAPLLACHDVWVPMISGRGLGITGGTLDKLESIPGFRVGLSEEQALAQLGKLGVVMIGQTADICPADRKLYALRDVTATVPSQPLIIASIMSKKLAENLNRLVLDVKWGSGAFMQCKEDAEALAGGLESVGREMGVEVSYVLSPMSEPLGAAVGNALEVAEAVDVLQGGGPSDLRNLTLDLAERVVTAPRERLMRSLQDGTAWRKFVAMVEAQHGAATSLEKMSKVHPAPVTFEVTAPRDGNIERVDAGLVGRAAVLLGAGRARAADSVDFAVGCTLLRKSGARVSAGEPIIRVHARSEATLQMALPLLTSAILFQD